MTEDYKGILCSKCGDHGGYFKGELCTRCFAQSIGEKCGKCGSPWVYIHAYMSDDKPRVPMCKPCCYAYIKLCGYLDDVPSLVKRMKDRWDAEKADGAKPEEVKPETPTKSVDGQEFLDM